MTIHKSHGRAEFSEAYVGEVEEIVLGQCFWCISQSAHGRDAGARRTNACNAQARSEPIFPIGALTCENISNCCVTRGWCTRTRRRCARVRQWPSPKDRVRVTVWWPISLSSILSVSSEIQEEKRAGSKAFCTMDCLQEYWQCPLAEEAGVIHICDVGGAVISDAGASGCHERHVVLPGDHDGGTR